jgi:hypothetical protein
MPTEPIPASTPRGASAHHLEHEETRTLLVLTHRIRAAHWIEGRIRFVRGESRRIRSRRAENRTGSANGDVRG